jgi:hypothetical protein
MGDSIDQEEAIARARAALAGARAIAVLTGAGIPRCYPMAASSTQ